MPTGRFAACILGCLGAMTPVNQLAAAEPLAAFVKPSQPVEMRDVSLTAGGYVNGQVVHPNGERAAAVEVVLRSRNETLTQTVTDADGRFAFRNLRGGVYLVSAGNRFEAFRLWAPGTSPPSARDSIRLVYETTPVVRGQLSSVMPCYTNERWLTAAAAIAGGVGVAVYNAESKPSSP